MVAPRLSLSALQVDEFFQKDGFGLISYGRTIVSPEDSLSLALHSGLLTLNPPICPCGAPKCLRVKATTAHNDHQGLHWVCVRDARVPGANPVAVLGRCRLQTSIVANTWFGGSKLGIGKILELTAHWFFETKVTGAAGQVGVSKECAIDWYQYCRQVCLTIVTNENICIGGAGLHVEIDETHLWTRKYHRGRALVHESLWVFGGICRETKEAFVTLVPDRSGATLWPIIRERIHQDSIILSDQARVYDNLHLARRGGYEHYQVNHSQNFVDPNDHNIHTNTVERHWGLLKKAVKGFGQDDDSLGLYLAEFVYRQRHLKVTTDRERRQLGLKLKIFLGHIAQVFPGPHREGLDIP
jgi:transposase-like protein